MLYAIQINLTFVRQDAEAGNILAALEQMTEVEQWLRQGIEMTRQLTVDLSPPILKSEGLTEALNWLITQMKQIHKLEVLLTAEHAFRMPDEDMRVLLFQIIRELLFNIVKHAGTDRVTVDLRSQNDQLVIQISDEGHGFNVAEAETRAEREGRFGLFSVRERVGLFGGRMEIDSVPGAGTRILIYIPIYEALREVLGAESEGDLLEVEGEIVDNQLVLNLPAEFGQREQVRDMVILVGGRRIAIRLKDDKIYPTVH
jgi:signal transduction histidine kinase